MTRADGNRSSVSSEGFCENDAEGELIPLPMPLPMVLTTGRGSNSSSSSGNNSSSSSNSGERNPVRNGARPKEFPSHNVEVSNWRKDVKDLGMDNINCFGFDEVEHAFLSASRSGSYPKATKQGSNSTDNEDEDVGLFDVACSSTAPNPKKPSRNSPPGSPSDDISKGSDDIEAEVVEESSRNDDSGAGEEEGACAPSTSIPTEGDPERRPSKDDSISSATSDSYHYSGDDYTVYYYDPKAAVTEPEKVTPQTNDSEKKESKPSVSPSIDKLLENVKKETDPWENLFARYEFFLCRSAFILLKVFSLILKYILFL